MFYIAALALMAQDAPPENANWDKEFGIEERLRDPSTGEYPVEPYEQSDANAGAVPSTDEAMAQAFGGQNGIRRITDRLVALSEADTRISDIFAAHDAVRLRRTLFEQFCFLLNAGCGYSGRDMKAAHKAMGLRMSDLNALVENLQRAMSDEGVPFAAQNRLLSKLAPMSRDVIER